MNNYTSGKSRENTHPAPWEMDDTTLSVGLPAVVGTLDAGFRIERISSEARILFDLPVDVLIGESLLTLVTWDDVPTCLTACVEAGSSQRGVTVNLDLSAITGARRSEPRRCDVLIAPLRPSPGYAFVLQLVPIPAPGPTDSETEAVILSWSGLGAGAARPPPGVLHGVCERDVPGIGRLTTRELQIVSQLLDGHRPPGIARALFLSQSTVRNHLASVFRKLGVASQVALLELFRAAPPAAGSEGSPLLTDHDRVTRMP